MVWGVCEKISDNDRKKSDDKTLPRMSSARYRIWALPIAIVEVNMKTVHSVYWTVAL